MPYGSVTAWRQGNRLIIDVELPDSGEPSERGRAENEVDPRVWRDIDELRYKLVVVRPYRQRRSTIERHEMRPH